ncbi:MAG: endonuclease [Gloeobacteraceae cyanobacterium ES-bin-316]|nr:endonuclease [Ferruginibacter sp.]
MPEGPSILHLKNQLLPFKGKIVKEAGGYGKMPTAWINKKKLLDILTWGKHILFVFATGTVKVHLGLFGDVLVNETKKVNASFYLHFANGEINGYVVKAQKLAVQVSHLYDWRVDILSPEFDPAYIKKLLKEQQDKTIDDVLMNQDIFAGVGNKIRNEALYRAAIHPQSITGKIPAAKITKLIKEVVKYAQVFYQQLETKGVHDDFAVYQQEYAKDGSEVTMKLLKKSKRKIYFSEHRQQLYV